MKKNGFIATSILYSFFLVFVTLFIGLITNYLRNQILVASINEDAINNLYKINNTKISDLQVGNYIKLATKDGVELVNGDALWVVSHVEVNGAIKKYYIMSDLTAQNPTVVLDLPNTLIDIHAMSVDIYEELIKANGYQNIFMYPNISISLPTASILNKARNSSYSNVIKNAIFNVNGSYVVYNDLYTSPYVKDKYYDFRMYNFTLENTSLTHLEYCGGSFDGANVSYIANNKFGYINIVNETVKNTKYINYCAYANPIAYTHSSSDNILLMDEDKPSDLITETFASSYNFRLMATIEVNENDESSYLFGGRGTIIDPYILMDGGKSNA